jgi:uncharacterized protein (TIGR02246 family)
MNQAEVSRLVDEVSDAWNNHDMPRFAACFAADAEFINVGGAWWRGRDEIEQRHTASHAGRFKHSVLSPALAAFKEVAPGIGVAHVTWELQGHGASGPERTTNVRRGIWIWVVRDLCGTLEIIASQNTDAVSAPSPPAAST